MRHARTWLPTLIVLGLAFGPSSMAEEAKAKEDKTEQPVVITNEDLLERYGKPDPASAPQPDAGKPSAKAGAAKKGDRPLTPLELMEQQKSQAVERKERVRIAEQELATAQAELSKLEKQLLATKNPFAARPELSEEEQQLRREGGETAGQRHQRTQLEVDKARAKVQEAEKKLADARAGKKPA